MAMLLGSVAAAIGAGLQSYSETTKIAAVTKTGRFILSKMAKEIRTAEDVSSTSTTLTILPIDDGSGLTQIQYEFLNGVLNYKRTVNGQVTSYPLLDSTDTVTLNSFTTTLISGKDSNNQNCTVSATAKLTFSVGSNSMSLTVSAAPRRNQIY